MSKAQQLRGAGRLAIAATAGITDLVEALHAEITRLPLTAPRQHTTGITGLVYRSVRGVTQLVGGGLDLALTTLQPLLGEAGASKVMDQLTLLFHGQLPSAPRPATAPHGPH